MKPGISELFHASVWALIAARISASSLAVGAVPWASCAPAPDARSNATQSGRKNRLIERPPESIQAFRLHWPECVTVGNFRILPWTYNRSMTAEAKASPFRVVHTVCSHDCPDSCAVLVTVDGNGRAIKVQGDPTQPVTQGFLCGKVAKYLDRVYSPDRILYPLKRKAGAPKGPLPRGHEPEFFERITWD